MSEIFLDTSAIGRVLDGIASLNQEVGSSPDDVVQDFQAATAPGNELQVFGENLKFDASIAAGVTVHRAAKELESLAARGLRFEAPADQRLISLDLVARLGLSAQPSRTVGQATLSGNVAAGGEYGYRCLATAPDGESRIDAFRRLIRTAGLPHRPDIASFPPGVSEETLELSLDLGLKATAGRGFALDASKKLFNGLSAGLVVKGEIAINAAIGFALLDRYNVLAGRGPLAGTDGAVRIRIETLRRRRLSLGASLAIGLHFEVKGLDAIVEAVFDRLPPIPRALEVLELVAEGDWDALQTEISEELADALNGWIEDTGWREWAAGDERVARLIEGSRSIVEAWQGLPGEIQALWGSLLGRNVDLGLLRGDLKQIVGLATAEDVLTRFEALSAERAQALTDLLELLSGQAFEEWLVAADEAIGRVSDLAGQALAVLKAPRFAAERLQAFADRTGITKIIGFLGDHLSTLDALEAWQQASVKKLATKLTGRVWEELVGDDERLRQLQAWAKKIVGPLNQLGDFEEKLKQAVSELKADVGFSVGIEIERLSQSTSLIDFEIERAASDSLRNAVEKALAIGDVAGILQALDAAEGSDQEAFRLRECLFFSRKTRTSATTTLLSIAGFGGSSFNDFRKDTQIRVAERQLVVGPKGRQGRWSGGAIRSQEVLKAQNQIALWLDVEDGDRQPAAGERPSLSLRAPFSREAGQVGLRVRYTLEELELRQDSRRNELKAVVQLLDRLGFQVDPELVVPDKAHARLALGFDFDPAGLNTLLTGLDDDGTWTRDYQAAGNRWLLDEVMAAPNAAFGISQGKVIAAFMKTQEFKDHWLRGARELALSLGNGRRPIKIGSQTKTVDIIAVSATQKYSSEFEPLAVFVDGRVKSRTAQKPIASALGSAGTARTDADYTRLIETFAKSERHLIVSDNNWPSTLFPLYLLIVRLRRLDPDLLSKVRGFASFRFREAKIWSAPRRFKLLGLR